MRMMLLFSIVSAVLLSACGATSLSAQSRSHDSSHFTYTRIYCTPNTETHFENVTVELSKVSFAPPAPPAYVGGNRPASSAFFLGLDARWGAHDPENRLNHPARGSVRHGPGGCHLGDHDGW
jgi:hypothetical protein